MEKSPRITSSLPPKLLRLLQEALWGLVVLSDLYLGMVLVTYHRDDPGWFSGGGQNGVANAGGLVGAWMSDIFLSLFGFSAFWLVAGLLILAFRGYQSIEFQRNRAAGINAHDPRRYWWMAMAIGFVVLLTCSSALEAMRFAGMVNWLPLQPSGPGACSGAGGVVGCELGHALAVALGLSGALMVLILLSLVGFSLFAGVSWLKLSEQLGAWVERTVQRLWNAFRVWQDRRVGRRAEVEREAAVAEIRKDRETQQPLLIAPPVVQIPQSIRAVKEKQTPLFEDLPDSELPPLSLLDEPREKVDTVSPETLEFTSRLIERKLAEFNVEVKVLAAYPGPVITRYEVEPAVGVKGSQIVNLVKDLSRALSVGNIRVVENIPGKNCLGLELPNPRRDTVHLSEIIGSAAYNDMGSPLTLCLGKDIAGNPVVADLAKMPHLLVAGTTGSGKSVAINAMILSLLYKATAEEVRLILIDPKMLELSAYDDIPHLLAPVVVDMKQAAYALQWCVTEMDKRYRLMSQLGVRNLAGYNHRIGDAQKAGESIPNPFSLTPDEPEPLSTLPHVVVVIDELADLMMVVGKKVEELIARIAQKARAAGIHLIVATQRPSVDVITGLIKANIPTRISFQVSSRVDSRTILDQMGAEALLGQGDMLYLPVGAGHPHRVHGAFVSDEEVHRVVNFLHQKGEPDYVEGLLTGETEVTGGANGDFTLGGGQAEADPLYDQAVQVVLESRRASISFVQRHLRIGYNRAARLIEDMEKAGLVSTMSSNGERQVLVKDGSRD